MDLNSSWLQHSRQRTIACRNARNDEANISDVTLLCNIGITEPVSQEYASGRTRGPRILGPPDNQS